MHEKSESSESKLIERIIDRDADGLQDRRLMRDKLRGKSYAELEKIWDGTSHPGA
jgi:hypothetical protein